MSGNHFSSLEFIVHTDENGARTLRVRDNAGKYLPNSEVLDLIGASSVTVDSDGTLTVNGTVVELGTDSEISTAIANAILAANFATSTDINTAILAERTVTGTSIADAVANSATTASATFVPKSVFTTKGDVVAGTGNGTYSRLGVGADGTAFVSDSTKPAGVFWAPTTRLAQSGGAEDPAPLSSVGSASVGTSQVAARSDHVHPVTAQAGWTFNVVSDDPTVGPELITNGDFTTAAGAGWTVASGSPDFLTRPGEVTNGGSISQTVSVTSGVIYRFRVVEPADSFTGQGVSISLGATTASVITNTAGTYDMIIVAPSTGALTLTVSFGYPTIRVDSVSLRAVTAPAAGQLKLANAAGTVTGNIRIDSAGAITIGGPTLAPLSATLGQGAAVLIGRNAGAKLGACFNSIIIGENAVSNVSQISHSVVLGPGASTASSTGVTIRWSTVIGVNAQGSSQDVILGYAAKAGSGNSQIIIGANAGSSTSSGWSENVFIGFYAAQGITTGGYNVAVGTTVGAGTSGSSNVIVGGYAYNNTATASSNVVIGGYAGQLLSSGGGNVLVGFQAGRGNGVDANRPTTATDQVVVGYQAGPGTSTQVIGIIALGSKAICSGAGSIAIGQSASSAGVKTVAIGQGVTANANGVIAIGVDSTGQAATSSTADTAVLGTARTAFTCGDPSGTSGAGAGSWKFGKVVTAASALDSTKYVDVMIDGTRYKLALVA